LPPSGDPAPLHPPRRGRAASDFRCPRELDILLLYARSRGTPGRVHGPVPPSGKATGVVHLLSISARVIRPLNVRLKW
jgi:hypothetical protein